MTVSSHNSYSVLKVTLDISLVVTLVANVSFQEECYTVNEEDGFVTVCIELTAGLLKRDIVVILNTTEYSALGTEICDC